MSESLDKLKDMLRTQPNQFQTPCYVYSVSDVERNYKTLKEALGTSLVYSFKANNCLDLIVRCGHVFEDGIEIASIGELNSLASGDSPRYINNPSADKNFIRAAISSKCILVIDHLDQLPLLAEFVGKRPIKPIMLRLNHEVIAEFNDEVKPSKANHFGMDWQDALKAMTYCQEHDIQISGFHIFKGSYSFVQSAIQNAKAALKILSACEAHLGYALQRVNLGGGFDSHWSQQSFDFGAYRQLLQTFPSHIELIHESGRGIMGSAGYFVTKVRYTKSINGQCYAICDGGMAQNFLLAKTETPFKRFESPWWVHSKREGDAQSSESNVDSQTCLLVGTSCNKEDVIGETKGFIPMVNDIAIFGDCGAYNASYTVSPFLMLPEPNRYLVE